MRERLELFFRQLEQLEIRTSLAEYSETARRVGTEYMGDRKCQKKFLENCTRNSRKAENQQRTASEVPNYSQRQKGGEHKGYRVRERNKQRGKRERVCV